MDEELKNFYQNLENEKFKYFYKDGSFIVYDNDLKLLPDEYKPKEKSNYIRIHDIEPIIKFMLISKKMPVEEYHGKTLVKTGFPSNYNDFIDICFNETTSPSICAIKFNETVSFSYASDSTIYSTKYIDDDLFSITYSLVNAYNCTEILFDNPFFERIALGWGIDYKLAKGESTVDMINNHMSLSLKSENFTRNDCCLLNIKEFDIPEWNCQTKQGNRLLDQWTKSPSIDSEEINKRLDLTECFVDIKLNIKHFGDMKRLVYKILNNKITVQEIIRLYQMIVKIPEFLDIFIQFQKDNCRLKSKCELINEDFVIPLQNIFKILTPLINQLNYFIDFRESKLKNNGNDKLFQLESIKANYSKEIEREFFEVKKKFPRLKFYNKLFKITRNEYNSGDFDKTSYVVIAVLKTGVTFVSKELERINKELEVIDTAIEKEENAILSELRNYLKEFVNSIEIYNFLIALMDIYSTFSTKSSQSNYSRPIFNPNQYEIENFFHPLLEHKEYVANNIKFEKDLSVLTGPNMGGKSTFLKSLSMISLYAQIGCYVPATKAIIPIFDKIFMRIGARDCASLKLSTFMVEMMDLKKIIKTATSRSLILIDELGRGTSAIDGLSLVLAVKEFLKNLKAKSVMATHFSELGDDETMNIKMSVIDGILTYKITPGICDDSFGLNTAKKCNFPEEVVEQIRKELYE